MRIITFRSNGYVKNIAVFNSQIMSLGKGNVTAKYVFHCVFYLRIMQGILRDYD